MAAIRGRNTKPEMVVRNALHAAGFRYRLHAKRLTGKPDIVLPRWREWYSSTVVSGIDTRDAVCDHPARRMKDPIHRCGSTFFRNRPPRKTYPKNRWFCLCPLKMAVVVCAMPQAPPRRRPHQNDTSCSLESSDASDLPAWVLVAPKQIDAAVSGRPTPLATDEWLTLAEVAQYLRLSTRTVSRMIKSGRLPAKRVGRAVRIARSQLMTMLTSLPHVSEEDRACRE